VSETKHDMLEAIANSITGIGFSALTIDDYRVKTLKIAKQRLYPAYKPTLNNVLSNDYPLSRYLYIYVDKPPNSEMPLAYREFFKFLFSHQGQKIILNHGAIPLQFNIIRDELANIIEGK
jgi:phosphate transport system substrate-binding protein